MSFNVRYMGHQNELEVDTRVGRRVFPRGQVVAMRGGEGQQLLRQENLQFERVMSGDPEALNAVDLDSLSLASTPQSGSPEANPG